MSSTGSQQGLLRKVPVAAVSNPVPVQTASSSGPKTNSPMLKVTAPEAATTSVTDNEVPLSGTRRLLSNPKSNVKGGEQIRRITANFPRVLALSAAVVRDAASPDFAGRTAAAQKAPGVFDGRAPEAQWMQRLTSAE